MATRWNLAIAPIRALERCGAGPAPCRRADRAPSLEIVAELTPAAQTLLPHLRRLAVVADSSTGAAFAEAGLVPVVDDGPLPGLALAATVLAELNVAPERIAAWIDRQSGRVAGPSPEALAVVV